MVQTWPPVAPIAVVASPRGERTSGSGSELETARGVKGEREEVAGLRVDDRGERRQEEGEEEDIEEGRVGG